MLDDISPWPWDVEILSYDGTVCISHNKRGQGEMYLAHIADGCIFEAHLMAAAPEMYAAISQLIESGVIDYEMEPPDDVTRKHIQHMAKWHVIQALKKAEGKTE